MSYRCLEAFIANKRAKLFSDDQLESQDSWNLLCLLRQDRCGHLADGDRTGLTTLVFGSAMKQLTAREAFDVCIVQFSTDFVS
jgi:hypothetical protein